VFRRVPFFEATTYIDWCAQNAVPVIHRNQFQIPWPKKQWLAIDNIRSDGFPLSALAKVLLALGVDERIAARVATETITAQAARARRQD
jgi:hypothetical protein